MALDWGTRGEEELSECVNGCSGNVEGPGWLFSCTRGPSFRQADGSSAPARATPDQEWRRSEDQDTKRTGWTKKIMTIIIVIIMKKRQEQRRK